MKPLPPNPVVLVTGASRGIGREIALAYARRGAQLVLAARTAEALAAVGREVEAIGAEVLALPTDITSPAAVDTLIAGAIERFGRIDILVNNAGIGRVGSATDAGFEPDVHATLNASLFGMIRLTQRVVPIMRAQNLGTIVNMSSVMGRKAFARFGSYAIVMHAVSAFSDALRQELVGTGIHVAVIHPALTATELLRDATASEMPPPFRHMTPLSAEKVAAAVVSAVTRRQRRVVLPWQANMLLLGEALSPWLGDLIARALTVRFIARLLGMSRGPTYHDTLARRPVARSAFLVAAAVTGAATMLPPPTRAADVVVHVQGLNEREARVGCALIIQRDGFPMDLQNARIQWLPTEDRSRTCRFQNVASGMYAISVLQDVNGNNRVDTNWVGIPTEPWGISNNVRHRLRAPSFEEASFGVARTTEAVIDIRVAQ